MRHSALRRERAFRGVTMEQVAARMGYSNPSSISRLERGLTKTVTRATVAAYSKATGIRQDTVARRLRDLGVEILSRHPLRAA